MIGRMARWSVNKTLCLWGFHDFMDISIPHVLVCSRPRCGAFRKVSSY